MQIQKKLLTINKYSRPGTKIGKIEKIVVHWVGNANSTAIANRNYFESLKDGAKNTYASSHYIVGLDGEILQCIPEDEVAYHAKQANTYSIGIEVCHPDWNGKFNDKTYSSLLKLLVELIKKYELTTTDIIRHFDVTGKSCPKYYVENQVAWNELRNDVMNIMQPKDEALEKAVQKLVLAGIVGNPSVWNSTAKINLKNVPALLSKMGGINKLVQDGVIGNGTLWISGDYTVGHVRSLIIKYAVTI